LRDYGIQTGNALRLAPQVTVRRFPPPWSVEELDACFVVDHSAGRSQ